MIQDNQPQALIVRPREFILAQPEIVLSEWINSLVNKYSSLEATDSASEIAVAGAYNEVHQILKQVEREKLFITSPARQWVIDTNNKVSDLTSPLEILEVDLKDNLADYREQVREAQAKEQARLQKLADNRKARAEASGKPSPLPEAVAPLVSGPPKILETETSKTGFRLNWKAERIIGQEHLIPKEQFMTEDVLEVVDRQVNAIARSSKGTIQIPGYRIYSEEAPVTRSK
jgi:hypothetical protein